MTQSVSERGRQPTRIFQMIFGEGSSLAALAGMSLSCFKRLFTVTFSMSPGRYVLTVRINAARHLLENTDKLVSDIASECGFFDQSHFSKAFTRIRGVTPGTYRRQHRRRNAH